MDVEQYETAIACAATRFNWPPDYYPDLVSINDALAKNEPTRYQDGFEFVFLSGWNECAWQYSWLDALKNDNEVGQKRSLDFLTNVIPNLESSIVDFTGGAADPGVASYRREIAAKAALGDPTLVLDWTQNNCYFMTWMSNP